MGGYFALNSKVDDIPERFAGGRDGVKLLVMGTVQSGGSGCICPESTILKALMNHLVLQMIKNRIFKEPGKCAYSAHVPLQQGLS